MAILSSQHRTARATARWTPENRPRNARKVDRRSAACPDCGADVGERCLNADGRPISGGVHVARRRLTTRLHNDLMAGDWDLLTAVDKISHKERRAILRRSGRTQSSMVGEFGSSARYWFHDANPPATPAGVAFARWLLAQRDQGGAS